MDRDRNRIVSAEELDEFITRRQDDPRAALPVGVPLSEATLAAELIALAQSQKPDPAFLRRLEARLGSEQALLRWPGPARFVKKHRRLGQVGFVLAGAALVILLGVFVLPLLLPRQGLRRLPSLQMLNTYAQRDGHTNGSQLPAEVEFVLKTELPASPARVRIFWQQEPPPLTIAEARRWAERFGLHGSVYEGDLYGPGSYVVVDNSRQVAFSGSMIFYLGQGMETLFRAPMLSPDLAGPIAEDFVRERKIVNVPVRAEPCSEAAEGIGNIACLVELVDGLPVQSSRGAFELAEQFMAFVNSDGQVAALIHLPLELKLGDTYPIRSAQEAWQVLYNGQPEEQISFVAWRAGPEPSAAPSTLPRQWRPRCLPGQRFDLYGSPTILRPVEDDAPPLFALDGYFLKGSAQDLQTISLSHDRFMHVWGQARESAPGVVDLEVTGWEVGPRSTDNSFDGVIERQGELVLLHDQYGTIYSLPCVPDDMETGLKVSLQGWVTDRTEAGYPVLDWAYITSPPEAPSDSMAGERNAVKAQTWPELPRLVAHIVQENETLQSIAWLHGVTPDALRHYNVLTQTEQVQARQTLIIPAILTMGRVSDRAIESVWLAALPFQPGERVEGLVGRLNVYTVLGADGSQSFYTDLIVAPPSLAPGWTAALIGPDAAIAQYNQLHVRVWGRYVLKGNAPAIEVERYERAYPDESFLTWLGSVELQVVQGREVAMLVLERGDRYVLADSLRTEQPKEQETFRQLFTHRQVLLEGVIRPGDVFYRYPIIEQIHVVSGPDVNSMTSPYDYAQNPPPITVPFKALYPKAYVEQVELIYHVVPVTSADTSRFLGATLEPAARIVQPMWRFAGRTDDGYEFEALVQAVRNEYLTQDND